MTRRVLTALVAGLLLIGVGLAAAGTAAAHSEAVGSTPEDGSTIDAGPARVSITFNEELQTSFPALTVVGPDDHLWSKGAPMVEGKTVSVEVGELGPVGEYTIAYRVTSADGHPVSGKRHFTLSKAGTGTPGPKPTANNGATDDGGSNGIPLWVFIVGAVVLFGGGLAFALFGGRSRKQP
ncbi:copper resistance CopC family protein [Nocardia australiensis]|uniref:copper resistance CopC family protein n=1 Tax=Nocardia australiensis TaxID=2887191 RepID=UPI001D13D8A0|nr:copper resistance CopC family protein [Nocardia australiensis]